ncbi:MAG: branched-chain amino acid ABC transporter permease [Deltaproteobacteria bacterium]|nr:branched-chain amino acid ABC transporter permease [Deltaproteobacteria bacterium]MBW2081869.1 branched-chain amino acid ABC transporter permease [Deltaproteobacteria bacterium]HDM10426.1 branched-chain amino acid ABC transporter permease [Desulfobacteraceae bacterium]
MGKRLSTYGPFIPVLALYVIIFLVGKGVQGMWQVMAMLTFYCALGQAFNIFLGMTGYVDFGYVAFLGVGTYGMALSITYLAHQGMTGPAVIIIGFLLALIFPALLSMAVGAVALRLRGAYFAIATIGVNEGFRYLIEGAKIWNGSEGMIFTSELNQVLGRDTASGLSTFWADVYLFIIAALAALVTLHFMRSRIGYALTALREDEDAAKVMGINVTKYKIIAFITSACFAGLVGGTSWALKTPYVFPPEVFEIHYTIEAIIIVLLGGAGTLMGPVIGALIYGLSKYYLSIILPGFQLLIFAPIIIVIIIAFPDGVMGVVKQRLRGTSLARFIE